MPYQSRKQLPGPVKSNLPLHAQDIYQKAFSHAWKQYQDPGKQLRSDALESIAHRVAWAAVKKKYEKSDDTWVSKE